MRKILSTAGLATAVVFGGAVAASAAFFDFTDETYYSPPVGTTAPTATYVKSGFTVDITPTPASSSLSFVKPGPTSFPALVGTNDGIGVSATTRRPDDEITAPGEFVTVDFGRTVTIRGLYFLDLFENSVDPAEEIALIFAGGVPAPGDLPIGAFDAVVPDTNAFGYREALGLSFTGQVFTFAASITNDSFGPAGDYALARIDIAPIPLPAGAMLLGTALAGFGLARRRKA